MKTILQHDERDCGAACLAMIAQFYDIRLPVSKVRELTKTDKEGTNLYGLVEAGKKLGFDADALFGSKEDLMESIKNNEIKFPCIAHIVSEQAMLHFIVISAYKDGSFSVNDPGKGTEKLPSEVFFERWTGYIVAFQPTENLHRINTAKDSRKKYLRLLRGQYRTLITVFMESILISAIGIAGTFVFRIMIDGVSDQSSAIAFKAQNISGIFIALIALYAFMALLQYLRGSLIILFSRHIDTQLTLSYFCHIMDIPIQSVSVRQTGEYMSRLSDIAQIRTAISSVTVTLLLDTLMAIGCGIVLYLENSKLFVISLMILAVYALIVLSYKTPIETSNRSVMEHNAVLQSYFKESIDGVETVKASCATPTVKEKAQTLYDRFIRAICHSSMISVSQDSIILAVELIGTAVILWIGFEMASRGSITVGQLITFNALLAYFTEPVKNLIGLQSTLQTAFVAADRLNDILELDTESDDAERRDFSVLQEIMFDSVNFRYGNRELTLKQISFSIKRGEKIAVVGESGSGKTTLAKLLLRFYEPETGEIRINGTNIADCSLSQLRSIVAYVEQNSFLFSDTIKNNLRLGNESATDEEIKEVCRLCCIHEFIESLPLGYDTPLDENGMNLSGGQRQRLSIARAMLKHPKLLILDEATSNLDTVTETGIKNTVFSLDTDLTCIIIAHRLTTIRNCDRIYVMEQGEIIENGTHQELMDQNGRYAELWSHQ